MDLLIVVATGVLAYAGYFESWDLPLRYQVAILVAGLLALLVFPAFGIYRFSRARGGLQIARQVSGAWTSVVVLVIVVGFITKTSVEFSRIWLGAWALGVLSALILSRGAFQIAIRWLTRHGRNLRRVVVVGAGALGQDVVRRLAEAPWTGVRVLGFFDDNPELVGQTVQGLKVYGPPACLAAVIGELEAEEVWLALPLRAEDRVRAIMHELRHSTLAVRFVPDIFGFQLLNHGFSDVAGIPVMDLHASPMVGINRIAKAIEDRVLAAIILVLVSPLLVLLAIGVKLSSRGPVFFSQERVSWNGRPFVMLKFRSMPVDAESDSGAVWAKPDEKRATPFGKFLRRTSLDELPQFINVLKGDMSIVGPRPERPVFVERFKDEVPNYMKKHLVKAGITGWAQVNGWRGDTDLCRRIEYDMQYIENWSLWFDLKIIFLTLFRGFIHQNAY